MRRSVWLLAVPAMVACTPMQRIAHTPTDSEPPPTTVRWESPPPPYEDQSWGDRRADLPSGCWPGGTAEECPGPWNEP